MSKRTQTDAEARMVFSKRDEKNKVRRLNDVEQHLFFKNKYKKKEEKK
jgi:hypothetical protein